MLRTNTCLLLSALFCLVLTDPALSRADTTSNTFDSPNIHPDNAEKEFSNALPDAQKEFSGERPDTEKKSFNPQVFAQKESPGVRPDGPSAGDMLKNVLNPDISTPSRQVIPSSVKTRVHNIDMGSEISYYRYQEPDARVKNQGPMYGYYLNYAYRPASHSFFNNFLTNVYSLQARYATSRDLEYSGSGIVKGKHDNVEEFRGLIGKDYFIGTDMLLTPYFGFGYRYLFDRGNGQITSTNAYLYDRKSHYYYLPLGGDLLQEMPNNWQIDLNAEYDVFIQGYQKSFLSDGNQFGFNNTDLVNHQDHGFGVRGSVKFIKHGSLVDFYVEPYICYWNIERSKLQAATVDGAFSNTWNEPSNNTTEVGSKVGVQF